MFTILVAEDDTSLSKMICAKLAKEQFRAIPAFDGEEALEITADFEIVTVRGLGYKAVFRNP